MSTSNEEHSNSNEEQKRRKRGDSKLNKETARYQCYCDKIYLSYPALYLHLKNKHPECFLNNRKTEATKFKEFFSSEGYKILRIEKENSESNKFQETYHLETAFTPKPIPNYAYPNYHSFPFSTSQNFMMPPLESKHFFMENSMPQSMPMHQQIPNFIPPQSEASKLVNQAATPDNNPKVEKESIIKIFNLYISETGEKSQLEKKEILEQEILFSLLSKCIKEKSEILKNLYNLSGDLIKGPNFKCLEIMIPYFKEKYLESFFKEFETKEQENFTKEEKWIQVASKLNLNIFNLSNLIKEVEKFEEWLVKHSYIKNFKEANNFEKIHYTAEVN